MVDAVHQRKPPPAEVAARAPIPTKEPPEPAADTDLVQVVEELLSSGAITTAAGRRQLAEAVGRRRSGAFIPQSRRCRQEWAALQTSGMDATTAATGLSAAMVAVAQELDASAPVNTGDGRSPAQARRQLYEAFGCLGVRLLQLAAVVGVDADAAERDWCVDAAVSAFVSEPPPPPAP